jgi:thiamine monophosphate synthase
MDFIMMLTRNDRTVENAVELVDAVLALGVRHVGFKDVGASRATMEEVLRKIRAAKAISYIEVVSTSPDTIRTSLEAGRSLGVDRILGGTDIAAARSVLGNLDGYFPFPGRPVGHPTKLEGDAALIDSHCKAAMAAGCGGVDLLAYRATMADPLDLVRAARKAVGKGYLIVAGSVNSTAQIRSLAQAGVDAFTIGSAVIDGSFAPENTAFEHQISSVLAAC